MLALTLLLLTGQDSMPPRPAPPPPRWLGLIGAYAWERDTVQVYEAGGKLVAWLPPHPAYPLVEASESVFTFPQRGPFDAERLIFRRGVVQAGLVTLRRLQLGPAEGGQLRLTPVRPVADLLREARTAAPPRDSGETLRPDLLDVTTLDSTIRLDIRYATTNNFLSSAFYSSPRAFLQRPAAEALARAHVTLRAMGYGLLIHDAYRPWYVTKVFWDATPAVSRWLVANPARGSKHNRGAAVDLTLYDLRTGQPVEMPSTYDEASPRAESDYRGGTARQRWHRALLRRVMEAEGFAVNPREWWHFDYRDWRRYPILNVRFEELGQRH